MFSTDQYQLLDYGNGRKLERFGPWIIDRPSPPAIDLRVSEAQLWTKADATYLRRSEQSGEWLNHKSVPESWPIECSVENAANTRRIVFELKRTPFGHLGIFPEQTANWDWIADRISSRPRPVRILNLFAYTGGSTMAAAIAGAEVAHVDAARNVVAWARRNAELSDLKNAPIRWITEDALLFAQRELKRGNRYNAVILDPPTYGHGPKGQVWSLDDRLGELLRICGELTEHDFRFILITCHSPGMGPAALERIAKSNMNTSTRSHSVWEAGELTIPLANGRSLPSGVFARWYTR